ncbi:MAG TPA: PcfK-like family protein [Tenuifilaceae bacterium]|nr:PcfK-like family protein [Tenuifilaceae bacterium]
MKATENFKKTIEAKLREIASKDELFAKNLQKENKNIDDCITYILNCVQKSGCQGFADDEIYGMAIHYYDEDIIDIGKPVSCKVVVNHVVELTPEEIQQEKEKAKQKVFQDEVNRLSPKNVPTKSSNSDKTQPTAQPSMGSLFS